MSYRTQRKRSTEPGMLSVVIRPPGAVPYRLTIDQLTARVRAARVLRMATTRDELKALRLKAMGVVGAQTQATADMYNRVIAAGEDVQRARENAEAAHMGVLSAQVADLREMADELEGFGQSASEHPTKGVEAGAGSGAPTEKPAGASAALAALNTTQPGKLDSSAWTDGDAYHGTRPGEA